VKILSICLILAGTFWALLALSVHLIMSGIAEPVSLPAVLFALFIGPLLLVAGPIFPLIGWHAKLGVMITIAGCAVITAYVIYALTGLFHVQPLQLKPDYTFWGLVAVFALLCDAGAFWLYRLVSSLHGH
jgi:hypothetical protein